MSEIGKSRTLSDAYVADVDAAGNPIWRQVLVWHDGEWMDPVDAYRQLLQRISSNRQVNIR